MGKEKGMARAHRILKVAAHWTAHLARQSWIAFPGVIERAPQGGTLVGRISPCYDTWTNQSRFGGTSWLLRA